MADAETILALPYQVDLTSCDREPVHHIGAVQPIGFLIAVANDWRIVRVSANIVDHLGLPVDAFLGNPLAIVLAGDAVHSIRNRLSVLSGPDAVERAFAVQLRDGGARYDLTLYNAGDTIVIEAEPSIPAGELNAGAMVRSMLARVQGRESLVREAARLMQALTGFDRVMIYRFHPDGSGEVIAERARAGLEPYLGLRYPASDIPQQARALLIRNPVRVLVDVDAEPSPLVSSPNVPDAPLDLSMSSLRAHSTMHIEFLKNMGVASTMTVSLLRNGKLWGLISCHHTAPRHVGFEQRTTAELFAQMLSFLIEQRERNEIAIYEAHTVEIRRQLVSAVVEHSPAVESITRLAQRMSELVPCDGVAVFVDGQITLQGETPTAAECRAMRDLLDQIAIGQIFATDNLGQAYAPARQFVDRAAGLLVLPISREPRDYLVFFRHELAHSVAWAGKPGKLVIDGPDGPRLSPRKSFETWRETVHGKSLQWSAPELAAAESMRVTLLELVLRQTGLSERESRAATQKQELLIAELNHRVRNILGLIRGLVAQSRNSTDDVDAFATILGDRVHALARAHDQITAKNWGPGSLANLIATEAAAFLGGGAARVIATGPDLLLQPQAFSTTVLVIHELMTNAAKHGALANDAGRVAIDWRLGAEGQLKLEWRESGGSPVAAPTRRGFGSAIIERSIPHELGGEVALDFAVAGLHARFTLPARHVERNDTVLEAISIADISAPAGRLSGTVLLVEDNMIIALESEDMLLEMGATEVLVASNVAEALHLIENETPSFALLDINLGRELSWPVALRLRELRVPHVFGTGYGDGIDYPPEHRGTPVVTKPYSIVSLSRVVGRS